MEETEFIWMNGELVPWNEAKVHVLTHALHYGSGAFEGIRAYETDSGPAIFRLKEHTERLLYSTKCLGMTLPFSAEEINTAIIETVNKNNLDHCYIRPLAYFGYGKMGLNTEGAPSELMIACWPWGQYLPHKMVDLKVSSYIRIHPRSTIADAKICGHYVNSIMAVLELTGTKYHEALLLDVDGNIAEGPGENFFMVKDGTVVTPSLGKILAGITRETIMNVIKDLGIPIEERPIPLEEVLNCDEAFYTGTAAEVAPIRSIDDKVLGSGEVGELSGKLQKLYLDIVSGKEEKYSHYLTYLR